jgi:hypothetical protein
MRINALRRPIIVISESADHDDQRRRDPTAYALVSQAHM